ncbi:MAG: hypothetical protein M0R21_08735 [Lentimicrobiaceae bacterium]|nr:hypothetical protein [Lentimicrobiaceae bacterium]
MVLSTAALVEECKMLHGCPVGERLSFTGSLSASINRSEDNYYLKIDFKKFQVLLLFISLQALKQLDVYL